MEPTVSINKRTPPRIATGFTAQQTIQITDGFRDALQLASYALTFPRSMVDPIFEKYFNASDHDLVDSKRLLNFRVEEGSLIERRGFYGHNGR